MTSSFIGFIHAVLYLVLLTPLCSGQDDTGMVESGNDTCSFINGQSCLNGICKYCALCINSACVLSTPYTATNDLSCATTNGTDGYNFYNYCISKGQDDNGDNCVSSSQCYQFKQSNTTTHTWENLNCNTNCSLSTPNGSAPPVPTPLAAVPSPTANATNGKESNHRHHHNGLNLRSGSPASIALTTTCTFISLCLLAWLARLVWKSRYASLFCCCFSRKRKRDISLPNTPPPSFHSAVLYSPQVMLMRSDTNRSSEGENEPLPGYDNQGPSPPKYEQAIVTQIRGFTFNEDHFPSSSSQQNTVWIPVYLSPVPNTTVPDNSLYSLDRVRPEGRHAFNRLFSSGPDWANTHIQHSSERGESPR
ncbi:hypothetical protein K501DRAFT_288178 [Backusella circina FSU 941]|nr:hypothetical protein K501DRAFT_288178 [Backusella circina FSU 941]